MLPFMPESPRFLMSLGRHEAARAVLAEYHANGLLDDELVLYEMDEIATALAIEEKYKDAGFSILWSSTANIKKMALTISVFVVCLWYVKFLSATHRLADST
jgi:hypothetical protein